MTLDSTGMKYQSGASVRRMEEAANTRARSSVGTDLALMHPACTPNVLCAGPSVQLDLS